MTKPTGTIMGLAFALTIPTASAFPAPSCPEVESARAMLSKAAATQNDRELQATRSQPETQAPRSQDSQAPRGGNAPSAPGAQDTVPPQMKRAATLVKEADTACQAGNTAEAAQKAKDAMVLMQQ
jgi:hypothetical protein